MEKIKKSSLQLEDEIELHQTGWAIQRIGWVVILVLVVAAGLGIFGTGPLSTHELTDKETTIRFERLARLETPMNLAIFTSGIQNITDISIAQRYLDAVEVNKIVPAPASQHLENGMVTFSFSAKGPSLINFYLSPQRSGTIEGEFRVNESVFNVTHFVYP